jgi:hypothetical protein
LQELGTVSESREAARDWTYLQHPCVNYPDMVVVICRVLLEFLYAALKIDLFPLVLEHLPIDGAFLIFLHTPESATPSLQILCQ